MKIKFTLLVCTFFLVTSVKAQYAVKTNILFPLTFASKSINFGLDIGTDIMLNPKLTLRSSIHANRNIISNSTSTAVNGDEDQFNYSLEKAGLRFMIKVYSNKSEENRIQRGFFYGFFADIMYAQTHLIKSLNGAEYYNKIEATGLFLGGGPAIGYTWKMNKWMIEPNIGIGYGTASGDILRDYGDPTSPQFLTDAENLSIRLTPSHFELHLGYEF